MSDAPRREQPRPLRLSVVVPCYNEEEVIRVTHRRLLDVLGRDELDFELELVYINDGSSDGTEAILDEFADRDRRVNVIAFTRNFGHQPAVTAGLAHATGDVVAVIDADLQDPPEVVLDMLEKWRAGFDVVYAVRENRKEGALLRLAYALFYRIYRRVADIDVQLNSGDFSLLDRRVVDVLNALPERNRFVRGLRAWAGFRQTAHVYERAARAAGETKYPFAKLLKLAFDGIFNFSTAPLTMIFSLGLITALGAAVAGVVYLIARIWELSLFGSTPGESPGFTTLIITLLFFSGVQLISMGIIGEYLGRIYQEAKMRPTFLIRSIRGPIAPADGRAGPRPERR